MSGVPGTGPSDGGGSTFLSFTSEPGEPIGRGESHRYSFQDAVWRAQVDVKDIGAQHVTIDVKPPPTAPFAWWWTLDFASPSGASAEPRHL